MKSFIYGIDGGDRRIFDYFEMPFYKQLELDYVHIELKEDLLNRGWSEIITGADGKDTSGFYMSPNLDGSAKFSMKYKLGEVPQKTGIQLIWDALPKDTTVGVMNVPSLMPVVAVNGFCVGSAGAGLRKIDEITDALVFPEAAKDYLNKAGYIPDIRLNSSGIEDIDTLFLRLKKMEAVRVECYIELARQFNIDFGLLIDRGTTVIQYLFMSEIRAMMNRDLGLKPEFTPTPKVENLIRDYYAFVDANIKKLFDALAPTQFILTADHGHEPMTHHCNPNRLLADNQFYFLEQKSEENILRKIKAAMKGVLPRSYRNKIKAVLPVDLVKKVDDINLTAEFDRHRTVAFSHFYMPGIYVNDSRFQGPVAEECRDELIERICTVFNSDPKSVEHGITAVRYRDQHKSAKYSDKLPDIRLNLPDYMFTTCRGRHYIQRNAVYGAVPDFRAVTSEMHTGTKGSVPLCLVDSRTANLLDQNDKKDLTLIYKLVDRFFNRQF